MADKIVQVFENLMAELENPEVRGYELRAHHFEVVGIRSSFQGFLQDATRKDASDIWRRADSLTKNLSKERCARAKVILNELKYLADQLPDDERRRAGDSLLPARSTTPKEKPKLGVTPTPARATLPWWSYDLLVVCALYKPELTAFLSRLRAKSDIVGHEVDRPLFGRTYFTGELPCDHGPSRVIRTAALFLDKMGMVDCAAHTVEGIRFFRPRLVAMTGVCAGRRGAGVQNGDLIIPSEVFTYDTGKHSERGFEREPRWCSVRGSVIQRVKIKAPDILQEVASDIASHTGEGQVCPQFHTDVMACGSAVIDQEGRLDEIAGAHRKVVGLDMESYALLRAIELTDQRITGLIVKGVMDLSTEKSDRFKARAAFWAARFLEIFLASEFPILVGQANPIPNQT